jgi:hypothetical protein
MGPERTHRLDEAATLVARERFACTGSAGTELPRLILESWSRSRSCGVPPDRREARFALVTRFLDDEQLRGRIAVVDVDRLEKINAVRSASLCVYFECFVREAFGARILPAEAFTAGLVQRGILSLGMG